MKILRLLDSSGKTAYAALQPDGRALAIEGCIFKADTVTIEIEGIGALTNPVCNEA